VVHFLADKLSGLRGRRFAFARVSPRTLDCFLIRHVNLSAKSLQPAIHLDIGNRIAFCRPQGS
jgi:hypothetical protein